MLVLISKNGNLYFKRIDRLVEPIERRLEA